MVPFNLKVAEFALWSTSSQKLDKCSLARAAKFFNCSHTRTSSMAKLGNIEETCTRYDSLGFAEALKNSSL